MGHVDKRFDLIDIETSEDKLEWVSVKSYGAIADGVTDDYSAIASAIAQAGINGVLYFPRGIYIIGNNLTFPQDLKIVFDNGAVLKPVFGKVITINSKVSADSHKIFDQFSGLYNRSTGVDDGLFNDVGGWTLGTGWSISGGVASHTTGNTGALSYSACTATSGRTYLVKYTIGGSPNGGIIVSLGGVSGFRRTSVGTYIEILTATGSGALTFTPEPNFGGTLDNVEVYCLSSISFGVGSVEYVNPMWFGAVGDDSTDNYLPLNIAFHQLGTIGRVYIPAGIYRFSQPLYVRHYGVNGAFGGAVVIEGSSMSDTILKYTGSTGYGINLARDGHAEMNSSVTFGYELHNYLSIRDCQIQANNTPEGGIVLGGAGHTQLEHLSFSNISNNNANAIFVRATEHEIYHSSHVNDTTKDFTNSGSGQAYAIRFKVSQYINGNVRSVKVRLGRTGSPSGTISASIYSDNSGVPGTIIGGPSDAISCSSLTTNSNGSEVQFVFSDYTQYPSVSYSNYYWIVLSTNGYTYSDGATEVWIKTKSNDSTNEFAIYDGANWTTTNEGSDIAVVVRFAVGILNNFESIHTAKASSINRAIRVEDGGQVIINNSEIFGKYGIYAERAFIWCDNTELSTTDGGQNAVVIKGGYSQWNKCYLESGSPYSAEFYGGTHAITQSVSGYVYWDKLTTSVKMDDTYSNFPKVGDPKVRDYISYCFFPGDSRVSVNSNIDVVSDSNALVGQAWKWGTEDRYKTVTLYFRIISGSPYIKRYLPRGLYLVTVYARATNTVTNDLWIGCHYLVNGTPTYRASNTYTLQGGGTYAACQSVFTIDEAVYTGGGDTYISVGKWEVGANTIYVSHITVERILGTDNGVSEPVCFNSVPSDADGARNSSLWFIGRPSTGTSVSHMAQIMGCHDGSGSDRKGKLFIKVNAGTDNAMSLTTVATITSDTFKINTGGLTVGNNGSNIKQIVTGSVNIDPPSISATSTGSVTFTLTGAAVGDRIIMEPPTDLHDDLIFKGARVTATNTVTVYIYNPTGSAIDDTSKTWNYTWIDLT